MAIFIEIEIDEATFERLTVIAIDLRLSIADVAAIAATDVAAAYFQAEPDRSDPGCGA